MPSVETFNKLKKRRLMQRKVADREARILGKSGAITPDLMAETAKMFGVTINPGIAGILATEHAYFENAMTATELEQFSNQTVVGIGEYKNKGFVLVLNELKTLGDGVFGLGFPGGRVRLGESPDARLKKEYLEETGLVCEVLNPGQKPVAGHRVGEEEDHLFSAYEIIITGGKPQVHPTKDEPIIAIVYIDRETLFNLCSQKDNRIKIRVGRKEFVAGVLRSHRVVFLEYLRKQKQTEVANV